MIKQSPNKFINLQYCIANFKYYSCKFFYYLDSVIIYISSLIRELKKIKDIKIANK